MTKKRSRGYEKFTDILIEMKLVHGVCYGKHVIFLVFEFQNTTQLKVSMQGLSTSVWIDEHGDEIGSLKEGSVAHTMIGSMIELGFEFVCDVHDKSVHTTPDMIGKQCTFDTITVKYGDEYTFHWKLVKVV